MDKGDVDIDFSDRARALERLDYVAASIIKDGKITKHNTGVYFHTAPTDPLTGLCSLDYETAESQGLYKIDFLNVSVYDMVRDELHLVELMSRQIDWGVFELPGFVEGLFHLGNHSELTAKLKPQSIEQLAMVLALIRPGKKHLQKRCIEQGFASIEHDIWLQDKDSYVFKKSHAVSYAMLVYVHANLTLEQLEKDAMLTA